MRHFRFLIAFVFVAAPLAYADAVYSYTGAPFDSEQGTPVYLLNPVFKLGESIDLTVDFSVPLAPGLVDQSVTPVSWSLAVGGTDYSSGDIGVTLSNAIVSTDSAGRIDDWAFSVFAQPAFGFSTASGLGFLTGDYASVLGGSLSGAAFTNTIGTWTSPVAVPEPSSLSLLIPGLAALFFLVKHQKGNPPLPLKRTLVATRSPLL